MANDTYEGITEYHSASPHVKTLQRFQELNIAMTRQDQRRGVADSQVMAMEESLDFTDESMGSRRWKYAGGGVRAMTPAKFDAYVEKVKERREEFMDELRARAHVLLLEEQRDSERRRMQEAPVEGEETLAVDPLAFAAKSGYIDWLIRLREVKTNAAVPSYLDGIMYNLRESWWTRSLENDTSEAAQRLRSKLQEVTYSPPPNVPLTITRPQIGNADAATWLAFLEHIATIEESYITAHTTGSWDPTGSHFNSYLQALRKDSTQAGLLNRLVRNFLDMPPLNASELAAQRSKDLPSALKHTETMAMSLSTHPSAGLSYLKSNNILYNHPILGPQKNAPPVTARFISARRQDNNATLYGVAGFVARKEDGNNETKLNINTPGGGKAERSVKSAYVDGDGRINVVLRNAGDNEGLAIREGALEPEPDVRKRLDRDAHLMGTLKESNKRKVAGERRARVEGFDNDKGVVDVLKDLSRTLEQKGAQK